MPIAVDVQTVSIAIASASVTVAAIYYIWQIGLQTKIRQTLSLDCIRLLIPEFLEGWEFRNREFRSLSDYKDRYGLLDWNQVMGFFEEVGVLLRRKLIDAEIVYDLFIGAVKNIKGEPL